MAYKLIEGGGVTTPKGFLAGACYVGVKSRKSEKPDVAIIYSEQPASCAAMFTTNKFCAAPVILDREILKKGKARAVVINSGNANACAPKGMENAQRMAQAAAAATGLQPQDFAVCSTGIIGVELNIQAIEQGVPTLVASLASLISLKFYIRSPGARPGWFLLWFSAVNFGGLAVLLLLSRVF